MGMIEHDHRMRKSAEVRVRCVWSYFNHKYRKRNTLSSTRTEKTSTVLILLSLNLAKACENRSNTWWVSGFVCKKLAIFVFDFLLDATGSHGVYIHVSATHMLCNGRKTLCSQWLLCRFCGLPYAILHWDLCVDFATYRYEYHDICEPLATCVVNSTKAFAWSPELFVISQSTGYPLLVIWHPNSCACACTLTYISTQEGDYDRKRRQRLSEVATVFYDQKEKTKPAQCDAKLTANLSRNSLGKMVMRLDFEESAFCGSLTAPKTFSEKHSFGLANSQGTTKSSCLRILKYKMNPQK